MWYNISQYKMNGNDRAHTRCVSPIKNEISCGPKHFQNFFPPCISSVPPMLNQPKLPQRELQGRKSP